MKITASKHSRAGIRIAMASLAFCAATQTQGADWPTESIGLGSVSLEPVGSQPYDWVMTERSTRTPPANPFITDQHSGPIQTNDWASTVIMDQWSKSLYAHPLSFRATSAGFEITHPPESIGDVDNMGETSIRRTHIGNVDLLVKPNNFSPLDARADKTTDWTYAIVMANGSQQMKVTIGHGLPFAFFEFSGTEPIVELARGTSLDITLNQGNALQVRVWDPVANQHNYYGVFAPNGSSFSTSTNQISADLPSANSYLSVAGLPDGNTSTFSQFKDRAYNFVTDTQVSWSFNESTGRLHTLYQVTTQAKAEGNDLGTVMALYPHQWRNLEGSPSSLSYPSIRGNMKVVLGNSFATAMDYHGILPRLPNLSNASDVDKITQHLGDYYGYGANLTPPFIQIGVEASHTGYDTYWLGKNLNRLVSLVGIADMLDDDNADVAPMTTAMYDAMKGQLEYWFNADKSSPDNYFYYNSDWTTLVGYPASYGSDNDLNDHHFHYGYWIAAAAQVALRDKQWAQDNQWGGMVKELINDIANPDRSSTRYPFLRNFDIYEGHSWASGTVPHNLDGKWSGGNNNEASSEGINAWAALILWGEATGDTTIRDLGIYLYTHEIEAANSYWFNLYNDLNFPHPSYPNVEVSRVWGGGYDHDTWWTSDPVQTHGINMLPITPASMYLGKNPTFVQNNFDAIWTEYELWDGDGGVVNKEQARDRWQDILSQYLAFADPDAALARWKSANLTDDPVNGVDPAVGIEFGESRAHTFHHLKTLQVLGQPDFSVRPVGHSLGLVFNKNGTKTYAAYNPTNSTKTLAFSDGKGLEVPANSLAQGPGIPVVIDPDEDGDGVPDSQDNCPNTPAGTQVDANGCPITEPDTDGDGVPDSQDNCPNTPSGTTVDANGCPITEPDSDGDGVPDNQDNCPNTPAGTTVDANGCPITEPDSDGDGVPDSQDNCPNTPAGTEVDANGCPVTQPDADGDGVPDANDQCANTPANTAVDSVGCPTASQHIEAEDYVDAQDTSPGNAGGQYRNDKDVDIEATTDTGLGFNIGWTEATEWLEYTIHTTAADYKIITRVASLPGGGSYTLLIDGNSVGSDSVGATGGWQDWQSHEVATVSLSAGTHTLRVAITGGSFNLNWIKLEPQSGCTDPSCLDSDNDGVTDDLDQCANTPVGATVNAQGCPSDADGDGVFDGIDQCANTPNGATVNSQGCPTDSDGDGVFDGIDQCANTPIGATVNAQGCPSDADGDGVFDGIDQCANTPSGTQVDAQGCPVGQTLFDIEQPNATTVVFVVNTTAWADVHYQINNGAQQNVRMTQTGTRNEYAATGLSAGDTVDYWFTYLDPEINGAKDSPAQPTYTVTGGNPDSDNDGVPDSSDQCPNTPAGATVNAQGCPIDSDGDGVFDGIDQCANTPSGATVNAQGCPSDSDGDGVFDGIDQCANTPSGTEVDAQGCPINNLPTSANLEAEDYIRYHDTTSGNSGNSNHRPGDDVDIQTTSDVGLGANVGWIANGEWLEFDFQLAAGTYEVMTRVASQPGNANYQVRMNEQLVGSDSVGATGGWQTFETHTVGQTTVSAGNQTLRVDMTGGSFNLNWISVQPVTQSQTEVATNGGLLVGGADASQPGFTLYVFDNDPANGSTCNDSCATTWPPLLVTDGTANGVANLGTITRNDGSTQATHNGKPLYFYNGDSAVGQTNGQGVGGVWWTVNLTANITPLYDSNTTLEPDSQFVRGDGALVTRFSDRPRTRHAREDQYQSYDHYIKFYFEDRSSNIEIVDHVYAGRDSIEMNVRTIFPLDEREAENRWWYWGQNTVAHYVGNGVMDFVSTDGNFWHYRKTDNWNRQFNRAIQTGDRLEFEISQFSHPSIPRGQANYYGSTYLYIVGEGIVPWYTENAGEFVPGREPFQEDSRKVPESYWLGGNTTLHYQYTDEPNDNFMQMATNLGYDNGQIFLEGRRVLHSSMIDGQHDEDPENGVFNEVAGLTGTNYINDRCTGCHERNGGAPVANNNELLDKWVFKVGDANGNPDPDIGRVLQPKSTAGASEGSVSISSWTELGNGLRQPNYQFSNGEPATFSARIAPRLVGLGLLEAIPESAILALEDPTDSNGDGISGVANRVADPTQPSLTRLGRFGWKAGTSSVKHQTAGALNTDMGVMTSVLPNPDCGSNQSNCGPSGAELSDTNLDKLVTYLSTLGVRPQRGWETGFENQDILQGKTIFNNIGCAGCHTETFQTSAFHPLAEVRNQTIHPYSDLLLHDMGDGLADNLGEGLASGREWRTTPLWGLGLAACVTGGVTNPSGQEGGEICTPHHAYLHDGRARTIDEAIRWHGGEGELSRQSYEALSTSDRNRLLEFLRSL